MNIQGMTPEGLQALNIEIGDGKLPLDDKELQFFYGNRVAADFYNPRTYEYQMCIRDRAVGCCIGKHFF